MPAVAARGGDAGRVPRMTVRDLSQFTTVGYDKGRPRVVQALWFAAMNLAFTPWFVPATFRCVLLRWFGAQVGERVFIRHGVRVLWPWKLSIGSDSWVGEGVWLLNLEPIELGDNVCLSQEAFLCTGSHDHRRPDFAYRNAPIRVGSGAWVGARAMLLPGVTVGQGAVVAAMTTVSRSVEPGRIVKGGCGNARS